MRYKNIIFDYGNVLATFEENHILSHFCDNPEDFPLLHKAIFENWIALDEGLIDYNENIDHAVTLVPKRLQPTVRDFFENWYKYLVPLPQTWDFIRELKERGIKIYILSNASVKFAEHADFYEITKEFDGVIFSAVVKSLKPKPEIYHCLFDTFHLDPADCFFLDDRQDNIEAAKALGMDGIVYTGDIDIVKRAIDF